MMWSLASCVMTRSICCACQLHPDAVQQQVDDLADLLDAERAEHDQRVDPVQEFRPELGLELVEDLLLHPVVLLLLQLALAGADRLEAERGVLEQRLGADVAGHDDDRVAEVDAAALGIAEVAVLQDLQQDVEDLRVSLLDLIEEHHGVALAAHGLRQLAAFLEAHVSRRRADQTAHVVALHELAHVDLDERVLAAEHELGQRLGELRLADAGGPQEDE